MNPIGWYNASVGLIEFVLRAASRRVALMSPQKACSRAERLWPFRQMPSLRFLNQALAEAYAQITADDLDQGLGAIWLPLR